MSCNGNMILYRLAKCCDASIFALAAQFHIRPHDVVRSSVPRRSIKTAFGFVSLNSFNVYQAYVFLYQLFTLHSCVLD